MLFLRVENMRLEGTSSLSYLASFVHLVDLHKHVAYHLSICILSCIAEAFAKFFPTYSYLGDFVYPK